MMEAKMMSEIVLDLAKQKENKILEQLGLLVSKGLLVMEETHPTIVRRVPENSGDYTFELCQSVRFLLKDQEYIEKLEKENKEMREILDRINTVNKEVNCE